jgi:hypothetical protein
MAVESDSQPDQPTAANGAGGGPQSAHSPAYQAERQQRVDQTLSELESQAGEPVTTI